MAKTPLRTNGIVRKEGGSNAPIRSWKGSGTSLPLSIAYQVGRGGGFFSYFWGGGGVVGFSGFF